MPLVTNEKSQMRPRCEQELCWPLARAGGPRVRKIATPGLEGFTTSKGR